MSDRPNILLLFSDQHRADVLGCENHPDVLTPHMDRLAAESTRFGRAYSQNAVCGPSRNAMFAGLYPRTLGCMTNQDRSRVMDEVVSMPEAFRRAGYVTAAFGKRHMAGACDQGWDTHASHFIKESADDHYVAWVHEQGYGEAFDHDWAAEWGRGAEGTPANERELPYALMSVRESRLPSEMTMEAWTRRRTIEFLRQRRTADQPFFCFASLLPSASAIHAAARLLRAVRPQPPGPAGGDGLAEPVSLRQPVSELPPMFQYQHAGSNRIWRLDMARQDEQLYRNYLAAYYALVEETDDHGDFVGAQGMVEKCASGHNVYEETLRVPLIMRWPGHIRAGDVCPGLAELVDFYPTLLALTETPTSPTPTHGPPLQGRSLAATLCQGEPIGRTYSVSENWSQAAVITDRYKLGAWLEPAVEDARDDRGFGDMFFDRVTDPPELTNLIRDPDHQPVVTQLRGYLEQWNRYIPRTMPRPGIHWPTTLQA